jgi:putative ABC transport system ATP-binding protein
MIELRGASLVYQDHGRQIHACREIDLTLHPGEFLGILGPSGSGKSSLLYLMSGLKQPTGGAVEYEGKSLPGMTHSERSRLRLQDFGFVFQYPYLVGYLSALENVLSAAPQRDAQSEAEDLLNRLGLGDYGRRRPHELSGGQRQRVCVARALVGGRKVVFADEPTASLDHDSGLEVMRLLREERRDGALVMVTHDPTMLAGADRIIRIESGEIADPDWRAPDGPTSSEGPAETEIPR